MLIGESTVGNLVDPKVVEAIARHNAQPIIFPLSHPGETIEALIRSPIDQRRHVRTT